MIKIINKNTDDLLSFDNNDLYSVRIKSLLEAYGTGYDFASFYCQYDESGNVTATMSRLDRDITISLSAEAEHSEIAEFLNVIGYSTVLCDSSFALESSYDEGVIMSSAKKPELICRHADINEYPKLMDLFNFTDYDKNDFESWYVDISHRIRHSCAKAYTLCVNDEIISSAIFSSIYKDDAVLSAVKTGSEFRRMGYGSALVSYMMCDIRGTVFLMRDKNRNEKFYKSLGFENISLWRLYK